MCRLGFISLNKKKDMTNMTKIGMLELETRNTHGCGYSYIDNKNKTIQIKKSKERAALFWTSGTHKQLLSKNLIWHVRYATHGEQTENNSHPFVNETGNISMCHNGVISGYEKIKKLLIKKHKFTSDTDSEIVLHAYEEWGLEMFNKFKEQGITGIGTILIMDNTNKNPKMFAYTDQKALICYKNGYGLFGYSEKNLDFLGKLFTFKNSKVYSIINAEIELIQEVELAVDKSYCVNYYGGYGYQQSLPFGNGKKAKKRARRARRKAIIKEMKMNECWDDSWSQIEREMAIEDYENSINEINYWQNLEKEDRAWDARYSKY